MKLELITSFYNPCGYSRIVNNFWRFRDSLNHDLTTVELSFNGEFIVDDAIQLQGNEYNIMWQKERLLNVAIERSNSDAIAWIDADLIFYNKNWFDETIEKLQNFPVVQLFENVIDLNADGRPIRTLPGECYGRTINTTHWKRPGGAWAARTDVLHHGLADSHIMGGGDCLMLSAMSGNFQHQLMKYMNPAWKRHHLKYAAKVYPLIRNHMTYVSGDCSHLFHGAIENRNYVGRWRKLTDFDFAPCEDIVLDRQGLWEWASEKPEMHQAVADYFAEREEDS